MIDFIHNFGILFLVIVAVSFLIKLLKQPIIIGYVLSGLLFSFYIMNKAFDSTQIIIMSELGITFLLFLMGLEFDLKSLKFIGKDIILSCALQSVIFFAAAFVLSSFFGFSLMEKVYLSIFFMFGSTLLVAKWVEDKKETDTLHGKIILGTLIVQDILAIIALTILNIVQEKTLSKIILAPIEGIALILFAFLLSKYLLNRPLKIASRYPELLFIFSLGVCFLFVEISPYLGYSTTLGAFIAGVVLANTEYRHEISGKLKPLINFFNMLFFVGLGFGIKFALPNSWFVFIAISLILCITLKPVVTYFTLRLRGYDLKTSFMSGIYLAQFSEFGIIITAAGVVSKAIPAEIGFIVTISVIISMIISSYFIKYSQSIYRFFEPLLSKIDQSIVSKDIQTSPVEIKSNIIVFKYYDLGKELYAHLDSLGKSMIFVDNDPEHISLLKKEGRNYIFGSPANPDFFEQTKFAGTDIIISNIFDLDTNKRIISALKKINPNIITVVAAKTLKDSIELYNSHADYVIYQSHVHEQHISALIQDYTVDAQKLISKKVDDLIKFRERDEKIKKLNENRMNFLDIDSFFRKVIASNPIKQRQKKP